ncbi:hypothetical protein SS05631_b60310 (plasmid) [Sinorhizobium sp. CCBAU 05631]|nr:hypothetical protein SS05631_b60310 [Sinorhizobium sp. CCBAU 05631]
MAKGVDARLLSSAGGKAEAIPWFSAKVQSRPDLWAFASNFSHSPFHIGHAQAHRQSRHGLPRAYLHPHRSCGQYSRTRSGRSGAPTRQTGNRSG